MPDLHAALQRSLDATYTLERELGGGGMSRVFVAEERRLGRKVVIKVLPLDLAGAISTERFEREIQLAARLQHPHIVPILAAGDASGLPFYTMPFVQGETLRDRMAREGRLPLADALRIAAEVADALACAHGAGVMHRDIKPENVLLSAGHAMVADFGIAKAISASRTRADGDAGLTQLGTSLGTPAYMSPEQAAGESELDGRTDVYSLGCVLYEMLAGRPPFTGPNASSVIAKRFMETPALLRTVDGSIPADVERIAARAIAREPDDRYATAHELLRALADAAASRSGPHAWADDTPSVAVLPFTNLSASAEDEYFSDGMTDEVINALARLPGLRVAARTSAFVFKGQRVDLRSIAGQLRVRSILEGTVRRAGSRVRISVQLVSAADGLHLWSERYDGDLADVFAVQDEIAQAIARALPERLGGGGATHRTTAPAAVPERALVDPAAYDMYLRGRFLFEQHHPVEAVASFGRAVQLDPGFARAHAWGALADMMAANLYMVPVLVAYPRARVAGDRARALDPRLPEGLIVGAVQALWFDRDWRRSEALAREALAVAPGFTIAYEFLGWSMLVSRRFADAIAAFDRAIALDPLSDFMLGNVAIALVFSGRAPRAVQEVRRGLLRSPGNGTLHQRLGFALLASGAMAEARVELERALELIPRMHQATTVLACVYAAVGDTAGARRLLAEAEASVTGAQGSAYELACVHLALGDVDAALTWLERAFEARDVWVTWLHLDPRLGALHGDPRFTDLVRRLGFAMPAG
jgi:serine/threonine-protein kinase